MKKPLITIARASLAVGSMTMTMTMLLLPSAAQAVAPHEFQAAASSAVATATSGATTEGEVRKVDLATKTLTIKHGDITNLDMPGMTMVFKVGDPAMLTRVKPGDKVRFTADRIGGALTVTGLQIEY